MYICNCANRGVLLDAHMQDETLISMTRSLHVYMYNIAQIEHNI